MTRASLRPHDRPSTPSRPPRFRRSVLYIFLGTLLLSLFTAGVAQEDHGDAPARFGVPLPHVGDKGTYTATVVSLEDDGVEVIEAERTLLHFEWREPRTIRDHEGLAHRVNELHIWPYQVEEGENKPFADVVYSFDVETSRLIASNHVQEGSDPTSGNQYRRTFLHAEQDHFVVLCGLQNGLQGKQTDLKGPVDLFRPCSYEDHWSPDGRFMARGTEQIGGHDTVFFAQGDEAGRGIWHDDARKFAWMSDSLPYPLRLTVERQYDLDTFIVIRLTDLQRGETPIETEPAVDPGAPLPPLERKATGPYGPDQEGLFSDFPIDVALVRAKEHADAGALRAYLADHPDAVVMEGSRTNEETTDGAASLRWHLTLSDGDGSVSLTIEQQMRAIEETREVAGIPLPPGESRATTTYHYQDSTPRRNEGYPAASARPTDLPTAASLAERWQAHASEEYKGVAPDVIAFTISCRDTACERSWYTMSVGTAQTRWTTAADGTTTRTASSSVFEISEHWHEEADQELVESRQSQVFDPSGMAPTTSGPTRYMPRALVVSIWTFPDGYWFAGAGLLATVVAGAYAFWPALKLGGAAGLFSRVSGPALLDHPVRARLYHAIEQNPGIHVQRLAAVSGHPRQTAEHHLRKLTGSGLVQSRTQNGYTCFYASGRLDRRVVGALPYLKAKGARKIMEAIATNPDASATEVATACGMAPSTVNYHVKRLREVGLVEVTRDPNGLRLRVTALGDEVGQAGHLAVAG